MTDSNQTENATENTPSVGRNEPCPCGSGKKYKRCCGVSAPPKVTAPQGGTSASGGPMNGMDPSQFDPQMMAQMSQLIQRLPKGQMQKLQSLMQKAMSGKDISREAQEFEHSLPVEFQALLGQFSAKHPEAENAAGLETPPKEESRFAKTWKNLFKKK